MEPVFERLEERDILSLKCERSLLIGIQDEGDSAIEAENHLNELMSLVETMGIPPVETMMVKLRKTSPRTLVGKGKLAEISVLVQEARADLVIFDYDLSPSQQRNLERDMNIAVIDREEVILDIFAERASTREAVLQIALARMQYSLPRLTRAWTHLSRQRGGAKGTRGKGETQLETDHRMVLTKIASLKKELVQVRKNRETQRKKRRSLPVPTLSIVGYTNAGKSSILNMMTGADVLTVDKLFATLDPTSRRVHLPGGRQVVITDTVGFIRKLPHNLIEAFKSTLEEAVMADAIIHVIDISSPEWREHRKVTEEVLNELGAGDKPVLIVFNKTDKLDDPDELHHFLNNEDHTVVMLSAKTGFGKEKLEMGIQEVLEAELPVKTLLIPPDKWDIVAYIRRNSVVMNEEYEDEGIRLEAILSAKDQKMLSEYIKD
ncbi:GTPase HflX [Oceanispirochaeta sp.]|uniref:GTPase HflX n=1 Tax=Oceanispirochaeta sp. TaxID=2035350 RepID=UPI002623E684|nr:GTPase HflX [Oceanispirochaeta sp.]MDA3958815.1 GTPase HflX [Oceanispirochaeta sp.]